MPPDTAGSVQSEVDVLRAEVEDLRLRVEHLLAERDRLFKEHAAAAAQLAWIDKAVRELPETSGAVRLASILTRIRRVLSPSHPTLRETLSRVLDGPPS